MSLRRSRLDELDARMLPSLRAGLRRTGVALRRPFELLTHWEHDPARSAFVRRVVAYPGAVALVAGVLVFASSLVHLQRFDPAPSATTEAVEQQPVTLPGEQAPSEVGPRTGVDLELYAQGRREALADLDPDLEVRAVVSFDDYRTPDEVDPDAGVAIESLLVRLAVIDEPPRQVEVEGRGLREVGGEIVAAELTHLEQEVAELRSVLDTAVDDPEFEEEFERRADELASARRELEQEADIVFGLVVVGTAQQLRGLEQQPGVRLVDPVGAPEETRSARLFGLLPDDLDRASHGRSL